MGEQVKHARAKHEIARAKHEIAREILEQLDTRLGKTGETNLFDSYHVNIALIVKVLNDHDMQF